MTSELITADELAKELKVSPFTKCPFARYWGRVVARAWHDTGELVHLNLKKTIWGVIVLGIAVYFIAAVKGAPEAFAKLESFGWGAVSSMIGFAAVFLFSFWRAPYRLEEDASAKTEQASNDLRARVEELRIEIGHLGKLLKDRESEHASKIAMLHQELERRRYANSERNAIRDTIESHLAACEALPEKATTGEQVHELYDLENSAFEYLAKHWPAFSGFDTNYSLRIVISAQATQADFREYPARRAARIEKLKKILEMLA